MVEHTGGCLCGAIRFRASGEPSGANICYCTQCRHQTGSAMPSFVSFPRSQFQLLSGTPVSYGSSPSVAREFCGRCGSALFWRSGGSEEADIYLGAFDRPEDLPPPKKQIWTQRRMPWVPEQAHIPAFKQGS